MRTLTAIACSTLLANAALAAPADPVARHAKLVADGERVVAALLAAEQAREAYDRDDRALAGGQADVQAQVKALNADNAAHKTAAEAHAADTKAYNARCGSKAGGGEGKKFKSKEELAAAKAAEQSRVADCEAAAAELKARADALDAQFADLKHRHDALDAQVAKSNASIDDQEARGRALNDDLAAAEDAADAWLEQLNAVLGDRAFQARADGVEGCKARREMVLSGKDLKTFHGFMQTCARNLKR